MIPFHLPAGLFKFGHRDARTISFPHDNDLMPTRMYPEVEGITNMIDPDYFASPDDYLKPYSMHSESNNKFISNVTSHNASKVIVPGTRTTDLPSLKPGPKKLRPSVVPVTNFNPKLDADMLVKALTSYGSNGEMIISIMTNRTLSQRSLIAKEYTTLTGIQLADDFKREIGGKFQAFLLALMIPVSRLFAIDLKKATKGLGTDENALIEILTTLSRHGIKEVRKEYYNIFRRHLADDVRGDTSGSFRKLLLLLLEGRRSVSTKINKVKAKHFAKMLYRAGELRFGVDKDTFIAVFCLESFAQLNEIFRQYELLTGNDIDEIVKSEFTFNLEKALRAIISITRDRQMYYAGCLYRAMKGIGTDDRALIRILVSRSEVDLIDIADAFYMIYGERLETWIKDDSSDYYRLALLSLLQPKYSNKNKKLPVG